MQRTLDLLEEEIRRLRGLIRVAAAAGESSEVNGMRAELRRAVHAWDILVDPDDPIAADVGAGAPPPPAREQVHQTLTLLGVPASPRLVCAVHAAFFGSRLPASRLASLRRDEERSYRSAPDTRPYYLCPALTSERLSPARALLCVSSWPLEQRIVGPLSARVDFLTAAIRLAETAGRLSGSGGPASLTRAVRLLQRFAADIPGARPPSGQPTDPAAVASAARAELDMHAGPDRTARERAARRGRRELDGAGQLFGARPR